MPDTETTAAAPVAPVQKGQPSPEFMSIFNSLTDSNLETTASFMSAPVAVAPAKTETPEIKAKSPEPAGNVATPEAPRPTRRLVEKAVKLGVPEAMIAKADFDSLDALVAHIEETTYSTRPDRAARGADAAVSPPAAVPPPAVPEVDEDEAALKKIMDPEFGLDPDLAAFMSRLAKTNKELKQKLDGVETTTRSRAQVEVVDAIDGVFDALAPTHRAYFGDKPGSLMAQDSPEMKRRMATLRHAGLTQDMPPREVARRLKAAAAELFPALGASAMDAATAAGTNGGSKPDRPRDANGRYLSDAEISQAEQINRLVSQWNNGAVAAPTSRTSVSEPYGDARAVAGVKAKLDSWSIDAAGTDGPELMTPDELFPTKR